MMVQAGGMMAFPIFAQRWLWSLTLFFLLFAGSPAERIRADAVLSAVPQQIEQCTTTCHVDAVAGDDANSGATPATALRTIQVAVERVQPGGEVRLAPGIYAERVVITRTLRLVGSGAAETWLRAPDDLPPAESPDSAIVTIAGAGVEAEVTGLTVAGPGVGACGSIGAGIFVRDGANATIHGNTIRDIRDQRLSDCPYGVALQVGRAGLAITGTATITNNVIAGFQKNGITVSGAGSNALIANNTITGAGPTNVIAQNGVQVSEDANATLIGNTIGSHSFTPLSTTATGLLVMNANADTTGNTFVENQVSIYHIDGDGVHDGNQVRTTGAGVGSYAFWGIVADDPPPGRLPAPFDPQPSAAGQDAAAEIVGAANVTVKSIRVVNNVLESDGAPGGFAIEADGGYGQKDIDFAATNNVVRNWDTGVVVFQCRNQPHCTEAGFVNVTIQANSITGNRIGLYSNVDVFDVDSTLNWWGAPAGPSSPGAEVILGDVNWMPWLCDGLDTDTAIGFQPQMQARCDGRGDLTVTHVIDWSGAPPIGAPRFTLCIEGPALSTADCRAVVDGAVQWENFPIGDYAVTTDEIDPAWAVTLPDTMRIDDRTPAQATVTTTLRTGALAVRTTVDWQGAPPTETAELEICVSGPSYPSALCQRTQRGELLFVPLMPGTYTVRATETEGWRTTIATPTVTIEPAQTVQVTVQNQYLGPTLTCSLLDNFNRADTNSGLGNAWAGATSTYRIATNQVLAFSTASDVFWNQNPFLFGSDQVACLRITSISANGHFALILKAQNTNNYSNGLILANYDSANRTVTIETVEPGQAGWAIRLEQDAQFVEGDVLGARASASGWVYLYRNDVLIGAAPTSQFFANRGGRIGFWLFRGDGARIDDFGGGDTPTAMVLASGDPPQPVEGAQQTNLFLPTVQR